MGITQTIISRLEADNERTVKADVLKSLAKVFGCTTDYLVGMHEDEDDEVQSRKTGEAVGV